jgi:hypothetical protein
MALQQIVVCWGAVGHQRLPGALSTLPHAMLMLVRHAAFAAYYADKRLLIGLEAARCLVVCLLLGAGCQLLLGLAAAAVAVVTTTMAQQH